jgi:membrane protein implicated in regulation of membrane protease activity
MGSVLIAVVAIVAALLFGGWLIGGLLSLAIIVGGFLAHRESIKAFRRAASQVKRDWSTGKLKSLSSHMGWYFSGNHKLDGSDENKEPETTTRWWLILTLIAGFSPMIGWALLTLPLWLGFIVSILVVVLYLVAIVTMVKRSQPPAPAVPTDATPTS